MSRAKCYTINGFSEDHTGGNPACVIPLERWLEPDHMQAIAKEMGLAETAFFVPERDGFTLRWFTPDLEIDLCGHATLAAAHCIKTHLGYGASIVKFYSKSGALSVRFEQEKYVLDFPSRPGESADLPETIVKALSHQPLEVYKARDYLLIYRQQEDVESLAINREIFDQINLGTGGVIVSAPGASHDFVSRFFTPQATILEDPVTGSAHCTLVPYWAKRLNKQSLTARQCSARGGELHCQDQGDRVLISGHAVTTHESSIEW
jgi:PhzF family phenazine biosynthesis protein